MPEKIIVISNLIFNIVPVTLVLGFMILIHEWGHFIAARLLGVRVDVFAIGFGPRLFGFKHGDTDYRLCALPFGGYVKMAGDTPGEERSGAPDEFLSKTRWQRVLIAVAGPAMNIILAVVIMLGLFMVGAPVAAFMSQPVRVAGVVPNSVAEKAGLQPGDVILNVNGRPTAHWEDAIFEVGVAQPGSRVILSVLRNGEQRFIEMSPVPPGTRATKATCWGIRRNQYWWDQSHRAVPPRWEECRRETWWNRSTACPC
jgi:regulator of sigma E protease